MARRANGEGTVSKRKDGRWEGRITLPSLSGGRRRRVVYGRTKAEVIEKVDRLRVESAMGVLGDPDQPALGDYVGAWLRDVQKERVQGTTYALQRGLYRNHIAGSAVAGVRLDRLRPEHVDRLLAELAERGVSGRVRQTVYALLRVALESAVRRRRIAVNPAAAATRPKAPGRELRALDAPGARKLLAAARGDRLEALYVLALTTGMRQGELFGLQWGDVDLRRGTVSVRRTQREVDGRIELGEPKTDKSSRTIALGSLAAAALADHRRALGAVPHPQARVFTSRDGLPLRRSNFIRRQWQPLVKRAGLAPIGFHAATRHTMASLALAENVNPKVVQERLGHSRIATTMDIYSHTSPELQRQAADQIDSALGLPADDSVDDNAGVQPGTPVDEGVA